MAGNEKGFREKLLDGLGALFAVAFWGAVGLIVVVFVLQASEESANERESASATEQALEDAWISRQEAPILTREARDRESLTAEAEYWDDPIAEIEADLREATREASRENRRTETRQRTITIYAVLCPLNAVGDGYTDACEGNPVAGTSFQVARPWTDATTEFVPTDAAGLVRIRFDAVVSGETLRVIQRLPAGTTRYVGYCLDGADKRLQITYPFVQRLDPSLGVTDIEVGRAREVLCDWFNVPTVASSAPAPAPPLTNNCDPSYPTLCLQSYPDLNCKDVPARRFPVYSPDPHTFDGDGDGLGCEL